MTDYLRDNINRQFADLRDAMRDLIARVDQLEEDANEADEHTDSLEDRIEDLERQRQQRDNVPHVPVIGPGPRVCTACLGTNINCPYCHPDSQPRALVDIDVVLDFIEAEADLWDRMDKPSAANAVRELVETLEDTFVPRAKR
jgi:hypothetical protein